MKTLLEIIEALTAVANAPAQDVNAELLRALKEAVAPLLSHPHEEQNMTPASWEWFCKARTAIARAEAAQTPKTHEGHNASRAVREASE